MLFIKGLLFGLTLQLSVGPVFFAVLHKSVKEGWAEAFKMVLGVALIDAFYIALSFTGIGGLLRIYFLKKIIYWGGAAILIFFGLTYYRNSAKGNHNDQGFGNSLLYGLKLTLTNPLTIVFWAGAFGALIASGKLAGMNHIILYSAGCVTATVLFLCMASFGGKYLIGLLLHHKALKILDYIVGTFLILFGLGMFWK